MNHQTNTTPQQLPLPSNQNVIRLVRVTAAAGGTLAVVGSAMFIALGYAGSWWSKFYALVALLAVFLALFAWLVVLKQPHNAVVWIMAACAISGGLYVAGWAGAAALVSDAPNLLWGESLIPADLPRAAAWILVVTNPMSLVAIMGWLTFGLLLFPDGRLPSRRWRWVGVLAAAGILAMMVGFVWSYRPESAVPAAEDTALINTGFLAATLAVVLALVSLIGRFRRSGGATREQFKWFVWGASIFVPTMIALSLAPDENQDLMLGPVMVATAVFLVSSGIAVGKYRLFDIDVVINKTVMVAGLGVIIAALYVGVVVGVGSLFGDGTPVGVQVAATVVVALAFGPVRRFAQQWANRAVYGERATPYEVLARFSHRAAEASDDELLARIPHLIVDGTGALEAALWVRSNGGFQSAAAWPESVKRSDIPPTDPFEDPAADYSVPVFHDGELLGGVSLVKPRGEQLPPAAEELVANLASGMGLALRNATLTSQLQHQVAELEASRDRILAAADEARRSLERDLDSGPQQRLVALKVMLGPTRKQAAEAGATKTAEVLAQLEAEAAEAIRAVREFSGGVYPPLLEAEGLEVTLREQTQRSALPTTVTADGVGRYSREVEAAVYFTILEALQNIAKYAGASTVLVALREAEGELSFEVTDDGAGFDPATVAAGSGLANMADRIDAIAGDLSFESAPGSGTTVRGTVPIGDRTGA